MKRDGAVRPFFDQLADFVTMALRDASGLALQIVTIPIATNLDVATSRKSSNFLKDPFF